MVYDFERIWDRTKKDIDVSKITGKSKDEVLRNLKNELNGVSKNKKQIDNLINSGLLDKLIAKPFFKKELELSYKPIKPKIEMPVSVHVPVLKLPDYLAKRKGNNRVSIRKQGRFRSFNVNNVKITEYSWRGKKAVSFYNKRIKKLITWGLVNE